MSRIRSAAFGYVALMRASVQPESDAKLSHTTGGLLDAFSMAAAIFRNKGFRQPEKGSGSAAEFQKVPSFNSLKFKSPEKLLADFSPVSHRIFPPSVLIYFIKGLETISPYCHLKF